MSASDHILTGCRAATQTSAGVLDDAALVIRGGRIAWIGARADLPSAGRAISDLPVADLPVTDLGGALVTPGLIDCHTHLVFGGHRAREFELRLEGASYEQIAREGGGILSTVAATRAASDDDLLAGARARLDRMRAEGVTTVEVKSGYGLDRDTELRMLRTARRLGGPDMTVRTTFLGAHAVPKGDDADAYLDRVAIPTLRAARAEGLADAVDAFCEGIAFSPAQVGRLFAAARELGLPVKLHAEQLSHLGGAALAARHGALSADHLEHATEADARAMAAAGTVAVLLPGAFYTLRETALPPVAAFRAAGTRIAVATDCNPGSSPLASPLLALNMACTLFRLTPAEALAGMTVHAAAALGLPDRGALAPGLRADLAAWDAETPAELAYRIGWTRCLARYVEGARCP